MTEWKDHLRRAIAHLGSQVALAREIDCSQAKISWLIVTAETISAEDAIAIDRATHGAVSKSDLRPDLWPPQSQSEHNPVPAQA